MEKRKTSRQRSIFFTIFVSLFCILLVFVLVFSVTYYQSVVNQVSALVYSALQRNADEIAISIDNNINKMNMVALDILDTAAKGYASASPNADMQRIQDETSAFTGNNRSVDQINVIFPDGSTVASGLHTGIYTQPQDALPSIAEMLSGPTGKLVFYSNENPYISSDYLSSSLGKGFVTLLEKGGAAGEGQAIFVEAKKSVIPITSEAEKYHSIYGENLYLFDTFGNQMYPAEKKPSPGEIPLSSSNQYFPLLQNRPLPDSLLEFSDQNRKTEYLIYHYSPYSNMYTLITLDKAYLMSIASRNYTNFIPLMIALLVSAGLVSLLVAKAISHPINTIYGYIKMHDFAKDQFLLPVSVNTNILEINTLIKSLHLMQEKINIAQHAQLELQKREMQSKMLSLQSQMNPHFLYNSLATMQAMASAHMNDQIITMCQTTSRILRYISSDQKPMVPLEEEISHTQDYLECMRIRYDGDLDYVINIPANMNKIPIPKLCVQLLVENSVKFTTEGPPPWTISILGTVDHSLQGNYWYLCVLDNGPGFSKEKLSLIRQQISQIDKTGLLPSLELKGMGLLNVYIRFRLSYPENFIFDIDNGTQSGAKILIGGKYGQ